MSGVPCQNLHYICSAQIFITRPQQYSVHFQRCNSINIQLSDRQTKTPAIKKQPGVSDDDLELCGRSKTTNEGTVMKRDNNVIPVNSRRGEILEEGQIL